ncbi:MAG: sensor histidine kinase [Cyanothece sp. SIO1E1]|nr:sensor histidine kinase [Cyanothece sp. SIO1E1]
MFQTTRRRLALWYTTVTAILLLLFATGFYLYVRNTLVERVDDTLNHVVEIVERSLVVDPVDPSLIAANDVADEAESPLHINIEASFRDNAETAEDDHIDLEWFSPTGELLWSTFEAQLQVPFHLNSKGETVHISDDQIFRQITQRVQIERQLMGYLRVSHPWFEVTKPSRQLIIDLSLGTGLMVIIVAAIGWLLSGIAMAPVRDSYQRLKQFTSDASHELRNPIAVIQTNVQVALADPDPQWQQHQLQVVERLTRRLSRLVDDLLFLARQDSNIAQLRPNSISLQGLLTEVIEEQQLIAADKGVTLALELPISSEITTAAKANRSSPLYLIQGDRDQLTRLFTNLISNAVHYTPSHGQVQISLQGLKQSGTRQLEVKVKDTGIGIPSEELPHLFDRFYRVDQARARAGTQPRPEKSGPATASGSGLGLAIAKAIVENHQGQIQVDSTPDEGTTFTVILPWQRFEGEAS